MATVKELRDILKQYPDSMEIATCSGFGDGQVETELYDIAIDRYDILFRDPDDSERGLNNEGVSDLEKQSKKELENLLEERQEWLDKLEKDRENVSGDEELSEGGKQKKISFIDVELKKIEEECRILKERMNQKISMQKVLVFGL